MTAKKRRETARPGSAGARSNPASAGLRRSIERVQTGVRLEKRLLQLLKTLASTLDVTLGDLLEGIVLHAIEGKAPFGKDTLRKIETLREMVNLDITAEDSHLLVEKSRK